MAIDLFPVHTEKAMSIVGMVWTWMQGDRIYSRLSTNAHSPKFLAKLEKAGLLNSAETIHAYFADRADGGCGYEVLWRSDVRFDDLRKELMKL